MLSYRNPNVKPRVYVVPKSYMPIPFTLCSDYLTIPENAANALAQIEYIDKFLVITFQQAVKSQVLHFGGTKTTRSTAQIHEISDASSITGSAQAPVVKDIHDDGQPLLTEKHTS